jgi:hypothetical protein
MGTTYGHTMIDRIHDDAVRDIQSKFPHAECATCDYATRSFVTSKGEDGSCMCLINVTCRHECESLEQ